MASQPPVPYASTVRIQRRDPFGVPYSSALVQPQPNPMQPPAAIPAQTAAPTPNPGPFSHSSSVIASWLQPAIQSLYRK